MSGYGRMIVARRDTGEVEAAGWDCAATREDACDWLDRGLTLEFVTRAQVDLLTAENPHHVFATTSPVGDVLSRQQALIALAGYN